MVFPLQQPRRTKVLCFNPLYLLMDKFSHLWLVGASSDRLFQCEKDPLIPFSIYRQHSGYNCIVANGLGIVSNLFSGHSRK